jgi:hypothetical protein
VQLTPKAKLINVSEDLTTMKKNLLRALLVTLGVGVISSVAMAAPVSCDPLIANVLTLGSAGCVVTGSNLIFSNFGVSATGGLSTATVGLSDLAGTGLVGSEVDLGFQLTLGFANSADPTGDLLLTYEVIGGISGVDINIQGTPVAAPGQITVTETVCSVAFVSGACPTIDLLGSYAVTSTNGSDAIGNIAFAYTTPVFIKKDISFNGAITSEFTNSQLTPEPMTFTLMGAGLLGLGIFGRRRFKK